MFVLSFIIDLTPRLYLSVFLRCKNIYKAIDPSTKLKPKNNEAISNRVRKLIHMGPIRWCHSQEEKPALPMHVIRFTFDLWYSYYSIFKYNNFIFVTRFRKQIYAG